MDIYYPLRLIIPLYNVHFKCFLFFITVQLHVGFLLAVDKMSLRIYNIDAVKKFQMV